MVNNTDNHELQKWDDKELNWEHRTDMQTIEERLVVRDTEANRTNYTAHTDATFIATDTGAVYDGDGTSWTKATREVKSANTDEVNNTIHFVDPADNFQGIIDAFNGADAGDVIYLQEGQYDVTGTYSDGYQLDLTKQITLQGAGHGSHIRVKDATTDSTEGIRIFRAAAQGITFRDLRIDGNQQNNGGTGDGNTIANATDGNNIRITGDDFAMNNVWSVNATGDGVEIFECHSPRVENCHFEINWEQNVHLNGCEAAAVVGNVMDDEQNGGMISTFCATGSTTKSCVIANNILLNGQAEGIKVDPGNGSVEDIEIVGNHIRGPAGVGLRATGTPANYDNPPKDIRIKDNTIREANFGILISTGNRVRVRGNEVIRNNNNGIEVDPNADLTDIVIADNDVNNNGISSGSRGILVRNRSQTLTQIRVRDNDILSFDSDSTYDNGVQWVQDSGTFTECLSYDNHIDGATAATSGYGNIGALKGDATISSGSTSVTVNHNLGKDIATDRVMAVPVDDLGAASYPFLDDAAMNATKFEIKVDADPTQDVRFVWWLRPEG